MAAVTAQQPPPTWLAVICKGREDDGTPTLSGFTLNRYPDEPRPSSAEGFVGEFATQAEAAAAVDAEMRARWQRVTSARSGRAV
jgi:hypothetical protein